MLHAQVPESQSDEPAPVDEAKTDSDEASTAQLFALNVRPGRIDTSAPVKGEHMTTSTFGCAELSLCSFQGTASCLMSEQYRAESWRASMCPGLPL